MKRLLKKRWSAGISGRLSEKARRHIRRYASMFKKLRGLLRQTGLRWYQAENPDGLLVNGQATTPYPIKHL